MEKERASRTRFAKRAIKPDEIAGELEKTDEVLGSPDVVELFVKESCQRLGSPLKKVKDGFSINPEQLPKDITNRMNHDAINKMAFDVPCPGASYVSRNHDLTAALAEYVFDQALTPDGDRNIAARLGVIRSQDVAKFTTLVLLRCRYLIRTAGIDGPVLAEESRISGFEGLSGELRRLNSGRATELFEKASPSGNLSSDDKKYWAGKALALVELAADDMNRQDGERAEEIRASHEKLRQTIGHKKVTVEPCLPPDVLAVSVLVPMPTT